jgi:hypothetical protein
MSDIQKIAEYSWRNLDYNKMKKLRRIICHLTEDMLWMEQA